MRASLTLVPTLLLALLVVLSSAASAAAAPHSADPGDIVINGDFAFGSELGGHPSKAYAADDVFVAYDWRSATPANVARGATGLDVDAAGQVEQLFATPQGDFEVDTFYGLVIEGFGRGASARIDVFVTSQDFANTGNQSFAKLQLPADASGRLVIPASELAVPGMFQNAEQVAPTHLRSVSLRLRDDAHIDSVRLFASHGPESRVAHLMPGGDDALVAAGPNAATWSAGDDGVYTFQASLVNAAGTPLALRDAHLCLLNFAQTALTPSPDEASRCGPAATFAAWDEAAPDTQWRRAGEAILIDVDASALTQAIAGSGEASGALLAFLRVDAEDFDLAPGSDLADRSYDAYFALDRYQAAQQGGDLTRAAPASPVLWDGDGDGVADRLAEAPTSGLTALHDDAAVIFDPERSHTHTPHALIITPDEASGDYLLNLQRFAYANEAGAPVDLSAWPADAGAKQVVLFEGAARDDQRVAAYALRGDELVLLPDGLTLQARIPAAAVASGQPYGLWAQIDPAPAAVLAIPGQFAAPATDAYSYLQTAAANHARAADTGALARTPVYFAPADVLGATGVATPAATAIVNLEADDVTAAIDGTPVLEPGSDGILRFSFALLDEAGRAHEDITARSFALYDAEGLAQDGGNPSTGALSHALVLTPGEADAARPGWYVAEIDVADLGPVRGPLGAWVQLSRPAGADGDGDDEVVRASWYVAGKAFVARDDIAMADVLSSAATALTVLDDAFDVALQLADRLATTSSSVFEPSNPLLNPGFEARTVVGGQQAIGAGSVVRVAAPPWYLALEQPRKSYLATQHVAGDADKMPAENALMMHLSPVDANQGLVFGQRVGEPDGASGLAWHGASALTFELRRPDHLQEIRMGVAIDFIDEAGTISRAVSFVEVPEALHERIYQSVTIPIDPPIEGRLLSVSLLPPTDIYRKIFIDNLRLEGATLSMGDARADVADGHAVLIRPHSLDGDLQSQIQGADGAYYLYDVEVVRYDEQGSRLLDTRGLDVSLRLDAPGGDSGDVGILLTERTPSATRRVLAVPADVMPAAIATPWAHVAVTATQPGLLGVTETPSGSGFYSLAKNRIAAVPLADFLDHDRTPLVLAPSVGQNLTSNQEISFVETAGGRQVRVRSASPYVESTTVTITTNGTVSSYPLDLTKDSGDVLTAHTITPGELGYTSVTTTDTRFTHGAFSAPNVPLVDFYVCRPIAGCPTIGHLSGEALWFNSTSFSTTGDALTLTWNFGDGSPSVTTNAVGVTHAYTRPGSYQASLIAATPDGRSASSHSTLVIGNRAPTLGAITVSPDEIHVDTRVEARAPASDPDGGTLTYTWRLDGVPVVDVNGEVFDMTTARLIEATGLAQLSKGLHLVAASVQDGQGAVVAAETSFIVSDQLTTIRNVTATVVGLPEATFALPGEAVQVRALVTDPDDAIAAVLVRFPGAAAGSDDDLEVPLAYDPTSGWAVGTTLALPLGDHAAEVVVRNAAGLLTSAPLAWSVRSNLPPVMTLVMTPSLLQAGDEAVFVANASDPDGRPLGLQWRRDGSPIATATPLELRFNTTGQDVGSHRYTLTVTDSAGASVSADVMLVVDDAIYVVATPLDAPLTQDARVLLRVTDHLGRPVVGAVISWTDTVDPLMMPTAQGTATTGEDGSVEIGVPRLAGLTLLPLSHTFAAQATAASAVGAPVDDVEAATALLVYRGGPSLLA